MVSENNPFEALDKSRKWPVLEYEGDRESESAPFLKIFSGLCKLVERGSTEIIPFSTSLVGNQGRAIYRFVAGPHEFFLGYALSVSGTSSHEWLEISMKIREEYMGKLDLEFVELMRESLKKGFGV